jgi:hypothetical protein
VRWRLVASAVGLFVLAGVALVGVLFGPALLSGASDSYRSTSSQPPVSANNAIVRENEQPGTASWRIPGGRDATTQIQAYASATSVAPGSSIAFYVSTQEEGTHYWIDVYRLGWYGGYGGRLITSPGEQVGHAQGYYNAATRSLVNCTSCLIDTTTNLVEANWKPSYKLNVSTDWTTGIYLAKLTDVNGFQTYVPFDVLGNSNSTYVVVTPDTTYAAYNEWGGYSLYDMDNSIFSETDNLARGVKVSFDRPYAQEDGSSQVLVFEADAIHWMERQGYNLSYISNVDLQNAPAQLLRHHAYISLGHDEYWTKEMRDALEQTRDKGVGLAFLGANAGYWQMRFEPDSRGIPNRTVVCYKVLTYRQDLARDPFYGKDDTRLTTQWRDPALNRPENALIGIMYSSLTHRQAGFPWQLSSTANSRLLADTALQRGKLYGCTLVGYEWDRVFANGATPAGLQVIGTSKVKDDAGVADISNTTYYIASSGALVFATGSIYWTTALDSYRTTTDKLCLGQNPVVPGIQKLMAHLMDELVVTHPSRQLASLPGSLSSFTLVDLVTQPLEVAIFHSPAGSSYGASVFLGFRRSFANVGSYEFIDRSILLLVLVTVINFVGYSPWRSIFRGGGFREHIPGCTEITRLCAYCTV